MSAATQFLVLSLIGVLVAQIITAMVTEGGGIKALLHCGPWVAAAAVAGGISLLDGKAQTIEGVSRIDHSTVVAKGAAFNAGALSHFGHHLLGDDIYVYVVFAILVGVLLFEIKVGIDERKRSPDGFFGFLRFAALGFLVPLFFGAGALTIVYLRT